jgi:hypothetical protein
MYQIPRKTHKYMLIPFILTLFLVQYFVKIVQEINGVLGLRPEQELSPHAYFSSLFVSLFLSPSSPYSYILCPILRNNPLYSSRSGAGCCCMGTRNFIIVLLYRLSTRTESWKVIPGHYTFLFFICTIMQSLL